MCPGNDTKPSDSEGCGIPFNAITPRSTLSRNSCTCPPQGHPPFLQQADNSCSAIEYGTDRREKQMINIK